MALELTHDAATARTNDMRETVENINNLLKDIKNSADEMVRSTWKGEAAGSYFQQSQSQTDDFDVLMKTLTDIVDKAEVHMHKVAGEGR